MALIKCSECGKPMSDKAKKCPHCGCQRTLLSSKRTFNNFDNSNSSNSSNTFIKNNWFYFAVVFVAGAIYLILFVSANLKEDVWYSSVDTNEETYMFSDGTLYKKLDNRQVAIGDYTVDSKTIKVQEDYSDEEKEYTCSIKINNKIVCNTEIGLETYKVID